MVHVNVTAGNVEHALKNLKRKLQREGIFRVLKAQRFFVKPCIARKLKTEEAISRNKKLARRQRENS